MKSWKELMKENELRHQKELQRKLEDEEIRNIAKTITLEDFSKLLSKINLRNTHENIREERIAKEAGIVIAFGPSDWIFLRGAINHEIQFSEESPYLDNDLYFDKIGFFWPYESFKKLEEWEKYLKKINKHYFKMSPYLSDCNFTHLSYFDKDNDGCYGASGIIFKAPKYDGIYIPEFRVGSYEDYEIDSRNRQREFFNEYKEKNYFTNWTCDACGGNQDTGCLSSSDCFRR